MSPTSTVLSGQLLDLGVLRLERATKRLQVDDFEGALADLKLVLSHMQRAAADPLSVQHLSAIISDMERQAG